jgi:hypothetical protein
VRPVRLLALLLVAVVSLVQVGPGQEGSPTAGVAVLGQVETYFSEWEGTVTLKAGEAVTQLFVTGLWTLALTLTGDEQARLALSELLVYVPEFTVGETRGNGFFITEAQVAGFDGTVDLATGACQFACLVRLGGLVQGLDSMAVQGSGNLRAGSLSVKGTTTALPGTTALAGTPLEGAAELKKQAKTWKHYALSDLTKAGAAKATCCGCENLVITTGGKEIVKVKSSSKKVQASKSGWSTEEADVVVRCRCCDITDETEESTITITWTDKAGNQHNDTVTVVCKKPEVYEYAKLPWFAGAPLSLPCKAGECMLVTFDAGSQTVKSVSVAGSCTSVRAEKGSLCCKQTNSVLIQCACSTADCTADVVVKYYDKKAKKDVEGTIPVICTKN